MSYTLHWPNQTAEHWTTGIQVQHKRSQFSQNVYQVKCTHRTIYDYAEKIGTLTPVLSLQNDVLFPNALAATSNQQSLHDPIAVGCKGNQLDNEFPLDNRTPTCVPLVQWPTPVNSETLLDQQDICALPVLNWESYIKTFQDSVLYCSNPYKTKWHHRPKIKYKKNSEDSKEESKELITSIKDDVQLKVEGNGKRLKKKVVPKPSSRRQLVHKIFDTKVDAERFEEVIEASTTKILKRKEMEEQLNLPTPIFRPHPFRVNLSTLRAYKNVPKVKVQGTWNFMYNQKGACDWTHDASSRDSRILLVAKGSSLRAVKLKRSNPASMISYTVSDVWDEERPETQNLPDTPEFLNDSIFQITAHRNESLAVVRRGAVIDLYNTIEKPSFLSSIPIFGYSGTGYIGYSKKNNGGVNTQFLTCDMNPYNPCEVATLDQNYILQYHDFVTQKSTPGVNVMGDCFSNMDAIDSATDHQQFSLNRAAGLTFANDSSTMYFYYNGKVYFYDRRHALKIDSVRGPSDFHTLLDLANAQSSMALSDQRYFTASTENKLQECISCVQRSQNPNYYYVGTSYRIFLMDWRVPKYPVIKLSHGMKSPAAYIDTNYNQKFEVVVAGSQQRAEIFSAVLDHTHVSCEDRSECEANNPILLSYPRHLSNSRHFLDTTFNSGYQFSWDCENNRAMGHCSAWCTGLSICTLPGLSKSKNPPNSAVVSTNSFGDIFYQEWIQKPLEQHRKNYSTDPKWTAFLQQWKQSMSSYDEGPKSPPKPRLRREKIILPQLVDCSVIIEPNTTSSEDLKNVEDLSFSSFTINPSRYETLKVNLHSVEENVKKLKKFKGTRAKRLVGIWGKDWKTKTTIFETMEIKEEETLGVKNS